MTAIQPILNIVVALHSEAKPLIEYYYLKKICSETLPFPVFSNKDRSIHLVVSGIGKIKTAAATTFLHCLTGNKSFSCFLNIGISGSSQYPIGALILAAKIV